MITASNITHQHNGKPVLKDVSVQIPSGGITALVGPNGAGKSTLLSLIARLQPLQSGQVLVNGLDVQTTPARNMARTLAILPQTTEVTPRLTVAELVGFGRYPHHRGRPGSQDVAKVDEAIETFDLTDFRDRPLDSLSGGQRQRAFVAMVFAQDTEYVLLDEPLNNLDIAASRSLMQTLQGLTRDHGRTVVIVLHDINYACAYADTMITLTDGRLGPCGTPGDIVSDTMMQQVFRTDARILRVGDRVLVEA